MKKTILVFVLAALTVTAAQATAQDKDKATDTPKPPEISKPITPLRVQVVFNEYDGEKKTSSLPYTLLVNADDKGPQASVRIGLKVPMQVSSASGAADKHTEWQNLDVNLDGRAEKMDDGRFLLRLNAEKLGIYTSSVNQKVPGVEKMEVNTTQPVIANFRSQLNLLLRDGQAIQSSVATDPITGHVVKVDVTVNVIK
jgi:hypothetical protein